MWRSDSRRWTMWPVDPRWGMGSTIASVMFLWVAVRQYLPPELNHYLRRWTAKMVGYVYPYVQISFSEYVGDRLQRNEAYAAIESYLGDTCGGRAQRLRGEMCRGSSKLVLSMDEHEEVTDAFEGATFWWVSRKTTTSGPRFSFSTAAPEEKRSYRLTFHRQHRELASERYLAHVMAKGRDIDVRRRRRKLYTNNSGRDADPRRHLWSHVPFEHPATFDTLAMDPETKRDIIQDLVTFRESKDYYAQIGKPWKRGYLLYGPPGTGKSTMVAAMANFLEYDVYDLELTAVKDNSALRRLLIDTKSKSIIVIEDIDCSLDLTGQRKKGDNPKEEDKKKKTEAAGTGGRDPEDSKVTLSGLLNFIDGLWSACGGERLIVFTTNHVEKLDPALIRRGRMDKHIELSYCRFEAFKVLARNYLGVESHPRFETVRQLLEEAHITPADAAELLIPKTRSGRAEEVDACLDNLVGALQRAQIRPAEAAGEMVQTPESAAGTGEEAKALESAAATGEEVKTGEASPAEDGKPGSGGA